jgi:hypothetical protein
MDLRQLNRKNASTPVLGARLRGRTQFSAWEGHIDLWKSFGRTFW